MYLSLIILVNCEIINDIHHLVSIDPAILEEYKLNDSWEWLEIVNDTHICRSNEFEIYQYFSSRSNSLQSLQACAKEEVVRLVIHKLCSCFPDITAPNKNIISSLNIIKEPIVLEVTDFTQLKNP
jgi:hypothetical protein